jgi:hypothetical protein
MSPASVKSQLPILIEMIQKWPSSKRFPVLDFLRVIASKVPAEVGTYKSGDEGILEVLFEAAELQQGIMLGRKELETNALLVLRILANLFEAEQARALLASQYENV